MMNHYLPPATANRVSVQAGNALSRLHTLTRDHQVPDGACNTYRAMLAGLQYLENDMHRHVHKENSILFPSAIDLEQERVAR